MITGVNDAPVSRRDILEFMEDVNQDLISETLLANDSDVDLGDSVFVREYDQGSVRDSVLALQEGKLSFSPSGYYDDLSQGEIENASFTYIAEDSFGALSDRTTVDVAILGVNDTPQLKQYSDLSVNESGSVDEIGIADVASDIDTGDVIRFDEPQQTAANIEGSNGADLLFRQEELKSLSPLMGILNICQMVKLLFPLINLRFTIHLVHLRTASLMLLSLARMTPLNY